MKNTYSEMKDSDVAWIGMIPIHWGLISNKYVMRKQKIICSNWQGENIMSLTKAGVIIRDISNPFGKMPETFDGYQYVDSDDLLMCLFDIDVTPRCVGRVFDNGITSPAYSRFKLSSGASLNYYYYYYLMLDNEKTLLHLAKNLRHSFTEEQLGQLKVPYPPLPEQAAIAAYLDEKCGTIDEIIAEAKASIEKYKAWKSSVIFEAVTKGLDPHAEMKDSGVEWIGKVPRHWDVVSLKRLYDYTHGAAVRVGPFGSALASGDIMADGIWVYNQRTVLDNNFMFNDTCVSEEKAEQLSSFRVYPGDILITTRGSIGKIAIVPSYAPQGILHPCIIRFRVNEDRLNKKLLRYIFNDTDMVKKQILYYSNSTTIDVLYSYTLKEIKIPLIPLDEQQQIIDSLDEKCAAIDGLIAEKEALIADMEAYKKSLIFETVTGKRKVC